MEHKDGQYMQSTENFVNSSMENIQQQHLNVAGCDVGVGVLDGDVGNKYDEHQHEEHNVGDDNEWKYVKEVQQSEKQQTLKVFDDNEFAFKEKTLHYGSQLLGNGNSCIDEMGDGVDSANLLGFDVDSNRNAYGINAEYDIIRQANKDDKETFGNVVSTYKNITESANHYNLDRMGTDLHLGAMKIDGDSSLISSSSEPVNNEENVLQVDVKIETSLPQNYVLDHDMADEEEPSSLVDNTTNGTSSLSENAPQPIIEDQLSNFSIGTRTLSVEDKENLHPSQLNPDAKEFIPSYGSNPNSPTSPLPASTGNKIEDPQNNVYFGSFDAYANVVNRHVLPDEDIVAESPRKHMLTDMDNISLPNELTEFAKEADKRPHEYQQEEGNETLQQHERMSNNLNGTTGIIEQQVYGDINRSSVDQCNQLLSNDFNNRMASLDLHDNSGTTIYNEYSTGLEELESRDEINKYPHYSAANEDNDDVMNQSVYCFDGQPIQDILNTVQQLPSHIGSENTSFSEDDIDKKQNDNINGDVQDINSTIILANKELLQIEEKEHVSHSPSTEEMHTNLDVMNNELNIKQNDNTEDDEKELFYVQQHTKQEHQQPIINNTTMPEIEPKEEVKDMTLNDSDIIVINDDDEDEVVKDKDEIAGAPTIKKRDRIISELNHPNNDGHLPQERDIEIFSTRAVDLGSNYDSNIGVERDNLERFERNLMNYNNAPAIDDLQETSEDDEEQLPTNMVNMEIKVNKELLQQNIHQDPEVKYLCDMYKKYDPTSEEESNREAEQSSNEKFAEPLKVDFAMEATNDINAQKILNTDFNKSSILADTECKHKSETTAVVAETIPEVVECIQLDDTIESVEGITNEKIDENQLKPEELITEQNLNTVNNAALLAPEEHVQKCMLTEKKEPCKIKDIEPTVVATAVAAGITAAVGTTVHKTMSVKEKKNDETTKKLALGSIKPSCTGTTNKTMKNATSVASTKTVGSITKKTSSAMTATTKPSAKPKAPPLEKIVSEKKPLKVIGKTMSAPSKGATASSTRPASAKSVTTVPSKTSTTVTRAVLGTTGQKLSSTKTRPATAPSSTLSASVKPTTLGLTDASKPKARSPRSTFTTQARKVATTAAKSPVKSHSLAVNGSTTLKSTITKPTPRAPGANTGTANKLFTARPAPKFTNPTVTITTTSTKRTATTTTSTLNVGSVNKAHTTALSKTPPAKLTATGNKTLSSSSTTATTTTLANKVKSSSAPSSASGKVTSSKNTTPRAIKKPQSQSQLQQEQPKQQQPNNEIIISPTTGLLNGTADYLDNESKNVSLINGSGGGDPRTLFNDVEHDHNASVIELSDA